MDHDVESDASSLSFASLSSSEHSEAESALDNAASAWRKRKLVLQGHIEDTIDRLHGHALRIERAGAKHRRERIELYRQKEDPKKAYEAFMELAVWRAKIQFPKASDAFRQRMAESFARRRIRFEYLKEHQKKRAIAIVEKEQESSTEPHPELRGGEGSAPTAKGQEDSDRANIPAQRRLQDQRTIYSGTVETKLDLRPQPKRPERAESVASVALRHDDFPPPPRVHGGSFQCPYCRLDFRAREAAKDRWR